MTVLEQIFRPRERLDPVSWCVKHVDFSRVQLYETNIRTRFDSGLMPYWNEPLNALADPTVSEVVVLKCSRAGASECVGLNAIRYYVAEDPQPILHMGPQEQWEERFFKERVILGLRLAEPCAEKLRRGSVVACVATMEDCQVVGSYPGSRGAAKGFGYGLVVGEEVSMWAGYSAPMLRKRLATYRFGHLCLISSPDPQQSRASDEDPIFVEFFGNANGEAASDQRYWMMPDRHGGGEFRFETGGPDCEWGLKWDAKAKRTDGTWDLQRVHDSAHYVTPGGYCISEHERQAFVSAGRWVATNAERAVPGKRGYHLHALYTQFRTGSFGHVAMAMLEAIARGPEAHRTFAYEYEARKWYGERQALDSGSLPDRVSVYPVGVRMTTHAQAGAPHVGKHAKVITSVDVQKDRLYWSIREWVQGGDSGLVDYGTADRWEIVAEKSVRHGSGLVLIDNSYAERRTEVFDQCIGLAMRGAIPCFGRDSLTTLFQISKRDPFEGTARAGRDKLTMVTWNATQAKLMLFRLMNGQDAHIWSLPLGVDDNYLAQLRAEEYRDGRFVKIRRDNHWLDCEAMSFVGAIASNVYAYGALTEMTAQPAPAARGPGVYYPD